MELGDLRGIGPKRLDALHAAGIVSLRDLLYTVPCRYRDMGVLTCVADARNGAEQAFCLQKRGTPRCFTTASWRALPARLATIRA